MEQIIFPAGYKKALLAGKKNRTIRFGAELGKYKKGRVYDVFSYAGKDWGVKVMVESVLRADFLKLEELGVRKSSIARIVNEQEKGVKEFPVDIIRFKLV